MNLFTYKPAYDKILILKWVCAFDRAWKVMVKTKFLVLSEDPIKGYELIFKPSLKSYSWNLMIFEVFIVDFIGVSNDIEDPNIFIPKDAPWWDLSHSREKNEILIEKSSKITIFHEKNSIFFCEICMFLPWKVIKTTSSQNSFYTKR
jgi:hypothetical protein